MQARNAGLNYMKGKSPLNLFHASLEQNFHLRWFSTKHDAGDDEELGQAHHEKHNHFPQC